MRGSPDWARLATSWPQVSLDERRQLMTSMRASGSLTAADLRLLELCGFSAPAWPQVQHSEGQVPADHDPETVDWLGQLLDAGGRRAHAACVHLLGVALIDRVRSAASDDELAILESTRTAFGDYASGSCTPAQAKAAEDALWEWWQREDAKAAAASLADVARALRMATVAMSFDPAAPLDGEDLADCVILCAGELAPESQARSVLSGLLITSILRRAADAS